MLKNSRVCIEENNFSEIPGFSGPGRSKTTELISIDSIDGGVEYGPELPEAVYQHAITTINSTVSLLSGVVVTHAAIWR